MLHGAWACHCCGGVSEKVLVTPCGCPYHAGCLPASCLLHHRPTHAAREIEVPTLQLKTRRELLRDIQAAGRQGLRVAKVLLTARPEDLAHLDDKGLVFFSPHRTAVFDAKTLSQPKSR